MKILWNSSTPIGNSGYGQQTKQIVRRLKADGHFVRIATKHAYFGWHEWEGIEICDGNNIKYLCSMLYKEKFDYVISFWDIWILHGGRHFPQDKWVAYIPIDTEWIATSYAKLLKGKDSQVISNKGPGIHIAMSKHGVRELKSIGLEPLYVPLGVDTKVFKPNKTVGRKFRKDCCGWTDKNFVIGSVGLNYLDDRKGFIPLMRAFKEFHEEHPEARLYLHTHAPELKDGSLDYASIVEHLGLYDYVLFADQEWLDLHRIKSENMAMIFNSFDVFCLPSKGEGFGIPLIEAQACGIPVITTNTTTGPELAGDTGWLIDVSDDDLRWMPTGCFRHEPVPSKILKCLEGAYNFWKYCDYRKIKKEVRKFALQYDHDAVWKKYWQPVFKMLEEGLRN